VNDRSPDISIVLLTYNGGDYLTEVFASIFSQTTRLSYEVIAIDSGSSDRTLEIIKQFPVTLIQISNREFGHGRTRNLGARQASGRYVVFLTQDATPANMYWLDNLVRPLLESPNLAGVYSRQIPRPNCNPWEARDINIGAGPISAVKRVNFEDPLQQETYRVHRSRFISFSNVSSCIRKSVLDQLPFAENILMMEDQEWCKRAIESGHWIGYEAASVVHHSHNHSLRMIYKRHYDYGVSLQEFAPIPMTFKSVLVYTVVETLGDIRFVFGHGRAISSALNWIVKFPLVRFAMRYGLYRGLLSRSLVVQKNNVGILSRPSESNPRRL
jgi:rhamnosyltransferase